MNDEPVKPTKKRRASKPEEADVDRLAVVKEYVDGLRALLRKLTRRFDGHDGPTSH
jgi:hypothetical protein